MTELNEQRLRRSLEQAAGEVTGAGDPSATWQRASHRVAQRRRRRRTASAAAAVLVVGLAAAATVPQFLGSDAPGEPDVADVDPGPEADPADEQSDDDPSTEAQNGDPEVATTTCADPERDVAIDYPADWHTSETGCRLFGPEPLDIEEGIGGAGGFEGVRIVSDVLERDFESHVAAFDGPGVKELVERDERTIDGRRAVRREAIASGEVGLPEGTRTVGWVIELDAQRVLVLHTDDAGDSAESFDRDVEVLDAMAESARPLGEE